jgi:hypothetical protein
LLGLALGLTLAAGVQLALAIGQFQQAQRQAQAGDVRAIQPWMTIPYIARTYRVPESYLLQRLHISSGQSVSHVTLTTLAARQHIATSALIREIQAAILSYRQEHATPTPQSALPLYNAPLLGRAVV